MGVAVGVVGGGGAAHKFLPTTFLDRDSGAITVKRQHHRFMAAETSLLANEGANELREGAGRVGAADAAAVDDELCFLFIRRGEWFFLSWHLSFSLSCVEFESINSQ